MRSAAVFDEPWTLGAWPAIILVRERERERLTYMQNGRATCKPYSLLYFPVKIQSSFGFFQLLRTSGSGRSYCTSRNLIGRRSPIIIPVWNSANQFEWTHTTWLNIHESSSSVILTVLISRIHITTIVLSVLFVSFFPISLTETLNDRKQHHHQS